ncbi:MAG: SRPBCC domain-containing protein [Bacteroidales bacterium]|nr:SRPBCC domain-containing protein [Bacteroidales bacterium]
MSKSIKLYRKIKGTPEEVYRALTNPFTIELWSGEPAVMSLEPDSEFSLLNGEITGRNIEFETNKRLKQQWFFEGEEEESVVTIKLYEEKGGTQLHVVHDGIPDEAYENMLQGWKEFYLDALQDFFEA